MPFKVQPNLFGNSQPRKDRICHGPIVVLLQGYVIRVKERRSYLSEARQSDV